MMLLANTFVTIRCRLMQLSREISKARVQGLKDDFAQLLPPEMIEGDRLDNLILAMLTRRDSSNLDVDPDATELISYGEYKAVY